jgi:hypothetical protein
VGEGFTSGVLLPAQENRKNNPNAAVKRARELSFFTNERIIGTLNIKLFNTLILEK